MKKIDKGSVPRNDRTRDHTKNYKWRERMVNMNEQEAKELDINRSA